MKDNKKKKMPICSIVHKYYKKKKDADTAHRCTTVVGGKFGKVGYIEQFNLYLNATINNCYQNTILSVIRL